MEIWKPSIRSLRVMSLSLCIIWLYGCNQTLTSRNDDVYSIAIKYPVQQPSPANEASQKKTGSHPTPMDAQQPTSAQGEDAQATNTTPDPIEDVWVRVRNGFRIKSNQQPEIQQELERFLQHPASLKHYVKRAAPYLHFITEEIGKRDLPMELALLPIIESGYEPMAVSPGGAAGIWQFMPATGKSLGLQQDPLYDGRRDIVASTQAALTYLKSLSVKMDGDWQLALAAYNAGIGRVRQAIRQNKREGKNTDFWSLKLPRETQRYVPRLLAVALIMGDPSAYGFEFTPIPNTPYFASVKLDSPLQITLAAEMAGISRKEILKLNPGFNFPVLVPKFNRHLKLPIEQISQFSENFAALPKQQEINNLHYTVEEGDNLGFIAQRFHSSIQTIKNDNNLKGDFLRVGQKLFIASYANRASHTSNIEKSTRELEHNIIVHIVRSGDSLWTVAEKYAVGYKKLALWNGLTERSVLQLGQRLKVRI